MPAFSAGRKIRVSKAGASTWRTRIFCCTRRTSSTVQRVGRRTTHSLSVLEVPQVSTCNPKKSMYYKIKKSVTDEMFVKLNIWRPSSHAELRAARFRIAHKTRGDFTNLPNAGPTITTISPDLWPWRVPMSYITPVRAARKTKTKRVGRRKAQRLAGPGAGLSCATRSACRAASFLRLSRTLRDS